jgi:hypothetical protein
MLRTALTAGLLTLSATPEPRHLPPGLQAVRILEGSARLSLEDGKAPDPYLTLLPEGVFFATAGYEALDIATRQLQANLQAMELRVRDYERAALVPCPVLTEVPQVGPRWTLGEVLLVGVAGVLVGAGAIVVLQSARSP